MVAIEIAGVGKTLIITAASATQDVYIHLHLPSALKYVNLIQSTISASGAGYAPEIYRMASPP